MNRLVLAALITLPTATLADDQLDRMEDVSEQANILMMTMMTAEVNMDPDTKAEIIATAQESMQWDDPMRAAGECMLDSYRDEVGDDGVDELLTNMEQMIVEMSAISSIDDMEEMPNVMPEGLTEEKSMEITRACGMIDLQVAKMSESGFMDAMMAAAMAAEGN
ncbi:hypothetical protein [Pseudooctadecabacter sp.]|uniref:hypothetical protein n=1 Tax=Pseudooctadecabacter sp. TaxID=1966338 RepID=UPI0025CDC67D|nr:hypothetical protein [Pseudooctadecabacter sp.]